MKITELEIAAAVKTLSATARGRGVLAALLELIDEPRVPARTHESRAVITLLIAECQGRGNFVRTAITGSFGGGYAGAVLYQAEDASAVLREENKSASLAR